MNSSLRICRAQSRRPAIHQLSRRDRREGRNPGVEHVNRGFSGFGGRIVAFFFLQERSALFDPAGENREALPDPQIADCTSLAPGNTELTRIIRFYSVNVHAHEPRAATALATCRLLKKA